MNRQQRRLYAREQQVKAEVQRDLERRQDIINDARTQCYMVGVALAVHSLYGKNGDDKIIPFVNEVNRQMCRIHTENMTFDQLKDELYRKTGIEFCWSDDE